MILFFDTETTGIRDWKNPSFLPRIVQLGAMLTDDQGRTRAELNLIITPDGWTVPEGAANVHGISTEDCMKLGVPLHLALNLFFKLAARADLVVAHNIAYDLDLLNIELANFKPQSDGQAADHAIWTEAFKAMKHFDTMAEARDIVKAPFTDKQRMFFASNPHKKDGEYKSPNLTEAYTHFFGKGFEGAHDAMADVRACRDIYFKLTEVKSNAK